MQPTSNCYVADERNTNKNLARFTARTAQVQWFYCILWGVVGGGITRFKIYFCSILNKS
jgi:hypothetical protein